MNKEKLLKVMKMLMNNYRHLAVEEIKKHKRVRRAFFEGEAFALEVLIDKIEEGEFDE